MKLSKGIYIIGNKRIMYKSRLEYRIYSTNIVILKNYKRSRN